MLNTKPISKRNNFKRSNKRKTKQTKFYLEKTVLGIPMRKIIQTYDTISTTSASNVLTVSPSGANYWNLSNLALQTDYTNISSGYLLCRITKLHVRISRLLSESQLATLYPTGLGVIYCAYYPTYYTFSQTNNVVVETENALQVSPFNYKASAKTFTLPSCSGVRLSGGVSYTINNTLWFPCASLLYASGQFSFGLLAPANPIATQSFLTFEVQAECEFSSPL